MLLTKFDNGVKEVFHLFHQKKYFEVINILDQMMGDYPDRLDKILFLKACSYTILEKTDLALATLQEGLENGIWWNPSILANSPDLKPLQDDLSFKMLLEECMARYEVALQESEAKLVTYGSIQARKGILSLHMRGNNINHFAPYWLNQDLVKEYAFGFVQSSQVFGYETYSWDNQALAEEEITHLFKEFSSSFDLDKHILSGASQGGKLAIEMTLNGNPLGASGFIAVIPAIRDIEEVRTMLKNQKTQGKGYIITGDKDPFYEKTVELVKLLEEYNYPCQLIVKEGLGHFFPEDFSDLLKDACDYVFN